MSMEEYVDGELSRKDSHITLARDIVRTLALKSLFIPKPAFSRSFHLTSWVESSDEALGYALATHEVHTDNILPHITAQFYKVSRDKRMLVEPPIDVTLLRPDTSLEGCVDNLKEQFNQDKDSLEAIGGMIGKTLLAPTLPTSSMDRLVYIALANNDGVLAELAAHFPSTTYEEEYSLKDTLPINDLEV